MEKKVLITFGLIILLITLYSALARENDTILVPLGDLSNETQEVVENISEETVQEVSGEPEVVEELEEIPKEVEEVVEKLPGEAEEEPKPELYEEEPEPELIVAPPEQKPGIITRFVNLGRAGVNKVMNLVGWVRTRDYISVAKNMFRFVLGLRLWIKILLIIIALIILLIIWAYYFRDTRGSNLRKARKHHKKGEAAHKRGDEESAEFHYAMAAEYREKAQEQW